MKSLSVIILTKNSASTIESAITGAMMVSDEVIIVDSGSTDDTVIVARELGAYVIPIQWNGYGDARNQGAAKAKGDYILNIDADEVITEQLAKSINLVEISPKAIYGFKRLNYLGTKAIRHGEWSKDKVWRLYNKHETRWDLSDVHEKLRCNGLQKVLLKGVLRHYTADSIEAYQQKMDAYARLSARKYKSSKKKIGWLKMLASPLFNLLQNYIFRLGILDGKAGWDIAKTHYHYNRNKYRYLQLLEKEKVVAM